MRFASAVLLLALAGCDMAGIDRNDGGANLSTGNSDTPAPPPPAAISPVVGRWADISTSCATPVELFGNGTFRAADGSRGHWRIEGDRLTITIAERVFNFRLVSVTRDRIVTVDDNGQRGESVRCG